MRFPKHSVSPAILGAAVAMGLGLSAPAPAHAEITVGDHADLRGDTQHQAYIEGVGRGIFWTSALLVSQTGLSMFCMPGDVALSDEDILSILDQQLEMGDYPDDAPVELALVHGFMNAFPCQPAQPQAEEEQDRGPDPFADLD